jgi:hypothetical protein
MKKQQIINQNDIGYLLVIIILGAIVFLQRCGSGGVEVPKPKIDTVIKYVYVHDTVPGKPKFIKGKTDTLWMDSLVYVPSSNYDSLLQQYKDLGNKLFATNSYETEFKLGTYGEAKVFDTLKGNQLIGSQLTYNLKIPEKEITIIKPAKPVRQIYVGTMLTGTQLAPIGGLYLGGLYKDRKDRIFGAHIGWNREVQYSLSSYWKINLK